MRRGGRRPSRCGFVVAALGPIAPQPHGDAPLSPIKAVYAVTQEGDVWWIDQELGEAQRVLDGTRLLTLPGDVRSVVTAGGTLIADGRGGRLVALDPSAGIRLEPNDTGRFDELAGTGHNQHPQH
jgi:hypothetical protein